MSPRPGGPAASRARACLWCGRPASPGFPLLAVLRPRVAGEPPFEPVCGPCHVARADRTEFRFACASFRESLDVLLASAAARS